MKKIILSLGLIATLMMGVACQPESVDADALKSERLSANADLTGTWKFKHFDDKAESPYEVTLEFKGQADENGKLMLSGRSSVNHYFAAYQADASKHKLNVADLGSTRMGGSPEAMQFEQRYFELLKNAASYQLKNAGQTLVITTGGDSPQSLYFERSK
ncbi:META domain-containing protein [Telluribacter sp. SYSU D00476]|uniref:META domain-containing protein n=1 Tax=Telluribacter sp. SYSU D00476 TaxID=2811430 RepID=UPI001FF2AB4A|nr:META domain-containing protein [Telluribacter sp. SYSU D00476]